MERKIGEVFEFEGKKYKCLNTLGCSGCIFGSVLKCGKNYEVFGWCGFTTRSDKKPVVFIEVEE